MPVRSITADSIDVQGRGQFQKIFGFEISSMLIPPACSILHERQMALFVAGATRRRFARLTSRMAPPSARNGPNANANARTAADGPIQ
jgi:hypothetical protein